MFRPEKWASCFGPPKRVQPPTARTTATIRIGRLCGFSAGDNCGCVKVTFVLAQGTAATIGKDGNNLGNNGEPDFLRRFTADVEPGGCKEGPDIRVQIERSIFAEPRQ